VDTGSYCGFTVLWSAGLHGGAARHMPWRWHPIAHGVGMAWAVRSRSTKIDGLVFRRCAASQELRW
jgi:hypothetical protein